MTMLCLSVLQPGLQWWILLGTRICSPGLEAACRTFCAKIMNMVPCLHATAPWFLSVVWQMRNAVHPACLHACLPACLHACLPTCLPACLHAYLPACLPACLHACMCIGAGAWRLRDQPEVGMWPGLRELGLHARTRQERAVPAWAMHDLFAVATCVPLVAACACICYYNVCCSYILWYA